MNPATPSKVQKSLEIIAQFIPTSPTGAPAQFVRDLAHRWKERGGLVAGKPRHSDRYLDDLLRALSTPVRSLTPKLVGRTHLKPEDTGVLVRTFLSHWDYVGDPSSGEIVGPSAALYQPMLSDAEIEDVAAYVRERLSQIGPESKSEVEATTHPPAFDRDINLVATDDIIAAEYKKSVALFSVGAGKAMLFSSIEDALIGFRDQMNRLRAIDEDDGGRRILIWTLDLGRQDFEDLESRIRFMNVESVISRFKALKRFKESVAEERWNWLRSRTIVVLQDTRSGRPDVAWLPAFLPHHVSFSAIPTRWAGSREFAALYGSEHVNDANYTIFLSRPAGTHLAPNELLDRYELHYFGHAMLDGKRKGLRLIPPGLSYVEALGTVFLAATQVLGFRSPTAISIDGMQIDPEHAIEKLRHHGFLLLRLDDFVKL